MFRMYVMIVFELFIRLIHFYFNVKSNTIMKRVWNVK